MGREHLVSALRTEIRTALEFQEDNTDSIVDGFIKGMGTHWSPILFRYMYSYWNRIEFNVIELNHLSNLFVGVEYDSKNYTMSGYIKTKHTKEDIIELIGFDKMVRKNDIHSLKVQTHTVSFKVVVFFGSPRRFFVWSTKIVF